MVAISSITIEIIISFFLKKQQEITSYPLFLLKQHHRVPSLQQGRRFPLSAFFMLVAPGLQWRYEDGLKSHLPVRTLTFRFSWDFQGQTVSVCSSTPSPTVQIRLPLPGRDWLQKTGAGIGEGEMTTAERNICSNGLPSKGRELCSIQSSRERGKKKKV